MKIIIISSLTKLKRTMNCAQRVNDMSGNSCRNSAVTEGCLDVELPWERGIVLWKHALHIEPTGITLYHAVRNPHGVRNSPLQPTTKTGQLSRRPTCTPLLDSVPYSGLRQIRSFRQTTQFPSVVWLHARMVISALYSKRQYCIQFNYITLQ